MKSVAQIIGLLSTLLIISSVFVEVGYFLVLGLEFFSALSISDHIAAVIRYLPIVLPVWAIGAFFGYTGAVADRKKQETTGRNIILRGDLIAGATSLVIIVTLPDWIASLFWLAFMIWFYFSLKFIRWQLPALEISNLVRALIQLLPAALFFLLGTGAILAGRQVNAPDLNWTIHKTDGSSVETEVLGVFSQGTLAWDGDKVTFHRNDSIARIEGERGRFPRLSGPRWLLDFKASFDKQSADNE